MVRVLSVNNDEPTDAERATAAPENYNIEDIIGVDTNIKLVNTMVMTTSVDNMPFITYNEDINMEDDSDKEEYYSSKGG